MNTSAPSSPEVRAVVCDLYGTLIKVLPPAAGAAERWRTGCEALLPLGHPLSLPEFDARCREAVAKAHLRLREEGESYPEVVWPRIISTVLSGLLIKSRDPESSVPQEWISERATALSLLHAACSRTCTAMPGALNCLERLRSRGVTCGIASNAQDYTRAEFAGAGFSFDHFARDLTFLSYEHGFAKPSPSVFAMLAAALAARGISPAETLMVGDRADNDTAPAAAAGWRTWLFTEEAGDGITGGTWGQLAEALRVF